MNNIKSVSWIGRMMLRHLKQMPKETTARHKLEFCAMCGWMVRCGQCGNNCCNGSYGKVDEQECSACPAAYDLQDQYLRDKNLAMHLLEFLINKFEELTNTKLNTVVCTNLDDITAVICFLNFNCIEKYEEKYGHPVWNDTPEN